VHCFYSSDVLRKKHNTVAPDKMSLTLTLVFSALVINFKTSFLTRDRDSTLGVAVGGQVL